MHLIILLSKNQTTALSMLEENAEVTVISLLAFFSFLFCLFTVFRHRSALVAYFKGNSELDDSINIADLSTYTLDFLIQQSLLTLKIR
jgi:hypothetical protein